MAEVEEDSATGREGVPHMAEVAATAEASEAVSAAAMEVDSAVASVEVLWPTTTWPLSNPRGRSTSRSPPEVEEEGEVSPEPATDVATWDTFRIRARLLLLGSEEPRSG